MPRLHGGSGSCHTSEVFRDMPGHPTHSKTDTSIPNMSPGRGPGGGTLRTWILLQPNDTEALNGAPSGKGSSIGWATQASRSVIAAVREKGPRALRQVPVGEAQRSIPDSGARPCCLPQRITHLHSRALVSLAMAHWTPSGWAS